MKKEIKAILIAAGVIILAVFYMLFADGKQLFQKDDGLSVTNIEDAEQATEDNLSFSAASAGGLTGSQLPGESSTGADGQGFSEKQKEEIREIMEACIRDTLTAELDASVKTALKSNLDSMLEDGSLVPAVSEYMSVQSSLVNLNTADQKGLMTLPGIGQAKAMAIIQYREKNGSFTAIEQLTEISGISDRILEQIRALVTI